MKQEVNQEWSQEDQEIFAQWEKELESDDPYTACLANDAILTVLGGEVTPSNYDQWYADNHTQD